MLQIPYFSRKDATRMKLFVSLLSGSLLAASLMAFKPAGDDIRETLCGEKWIPEKVLTAEGEKKVQKSAKNNYWLFNPDNTVVVYESGNTETANWLFDEVTRILTMNFSKSKRYHEFVLYRIDKKELQLIDLKNKQRLIYER